MTAPMRALCRTLSGGRVGLLEEAPEGNVALTFVDFGPSREETVADPLHVLTEHGEVFSLHDLVDAGTSATYLALNGEPAEDGLPDVIERPKIWSNIAVSGRYAWTAEQTVCTISFEVPKAEHLLKPWRRIELFAKGDPAAVPDFTIFRTECRLGRISCAMTPTYAGPGHVLKSTSAVLSVELSEPCKITEIDVQLQDCLDFLTFLCGAEIRPSRPEVSPCTLAERLALPREKYDRGAHAVHWAWTAGGERLDVPSHLGAPFRTSLEAEVSAFEAALSQWMNRDDAWHHASVFMRRCFEGRNRLGPERLLDAWRWLEMLPNAKPERLSGMEEVIADLRRAVSSTSSYTKLDTDIQKRIEGLLGVVSTEGHKARITRLIGDVEGVLPSGIDRRALKKDLGPARWFRNEIAHGDCTFTKEIDHQKLFRSTLALETLCTALTTVGLPMTEFGKDTFGQHRVFDAYANAL